MLSALAHAIQSKNHYLDSLQNVVRQEPDALEWLVIAHDDTALANRLSGVLSDKRSATLSIPQSEWNFGDDALADAVNWSVETARVKHILLVGHSQAAVPLQRAGNGADRSEPRDSGAVTESSYGRLLNGAKRVQNQVQSSKDLFAGQINDLCGIPGLQTAVAEGKLRLHTLFCVAHSDTFLIYDAVKQAYHLNR